MHRDGPAFWAALAAASLIAAWGAWKAAAPAPRHPSIIVERTAP